MATTPGGDEGLLIPIQFSLEEARAALAQLEAQARAAGVRVGQGVSGGASKGLKDLKESMGRGRETAMFFTQALAEFGPQGRTAQIAIAGVAGAFIGGGGLLAVLSLAQAGVRLIVDAWEAEAEAAKKAAEESVKWSETLHTQTTAFLDDVTKSIEGMRGATAAMQQMRTGIVPLQQQELLVSMQLAEATERRATAEEKMQAALDQGLLGEGADLALEFDQASAQVEFLQKQLERLQDSITKRTAAVAQMVDSEQAQARRAKADEWSAALQASADADQARLLKQELAVQQAADKAYGELAKYAQAVRSLQQDATMGIIQARMEQAAPTPNLDAFLKEQKDFITATEIQKQALDDLEATGKNAYQSLARSAASAFGPMLTGSRAYAQAMRAAGGAAKTSADLSAAAFAAMLQGVLASIAQESAVKSLFQVAEGLAALATPGMQASAAAHFAAAGKYALVAGVAGAGAMVIGATRGMTANERADVAAQQGSSGGTGASPVGSGAREFGGGSGSIAERHTRELIVVMGSPFETPQETARRAARTLQLAGELNMLPRD